MKIMVADNDYHLVDVLSYWLKKNHFEVVRAFDAEQTLRNWRETSPDLVVIDVQILRRVGSAIYSQRRDATRALVLPLTTCELSQGEMHSLELEHGNYLRKPFNFRQLLALIKSNVQRVPGMETPSKSSMVTIGAITLDARHHEVMRSGEKIRLTPTESRLLHTLMTHTGQVLSNDVILERIRGYDRPVETGLVKTHIRHLRQKVERDASNPEYIMTVLGAGYTFSHSLSSSLVAGKGN